MVDDTLYRGLVALVNEDFLEAKGLFLKVIQSTSNESDRVEATKNLGFAYMGLTHYADARTQFESIYNTLSKPISTRVTREFAEACFYDAAYSRAKLLFESLPPSNEMKRWIRKAEREIENQPKTSASSSTPKTSSQKSPVVAPSKKSVYDKLYWNHFQMGPDLVINLLGARVIPKEHRHVEIQAPSTVKVTFQAPSEDAPYVKSFHLYGTFSEGSVRHTPAKTEITLKTTAETWPSLEKSESTTNSRSVYSGRQPDDWDKIEQSARQALEKDKPEGDQALNQLFETIYANATPETKMAMKKSFIESGGTVLSTNWDEVGNKRVDPSPPPGMEYKKYNH